jgi:hypothetical protein
MNLSKLLLTTLLLSPFTAPAQTVTPPAESNTELKLLVQEDQRVRTPTPLTPAERTAITRTDADRLSEVKKMIAAAQLHTGLDYCSAALIVQHSKESDDYLLAHTLAIIGASKGDQGCVWLSAATLDRYLMSIKQPQIFGTQYMHLDPTKPWTQDPYNRSVISDTLRPDLHLLSAAEQKKRLDDDNAPPAVH